jgi:DNA modification methylase
MLATLPDASVQCVVTSPPYYGLRDYGTAQWDGGMEGCDHRAGSDYGTKNDTNCGAIRGGPFRSICGKCGARRIDAQIGLEATPDEFIAQMVAVFREVRRVLRPDGTLWLNLGGAYQNKQLDMMPARVALALQADGWWLRSDIIWAKPNPMPESVTDRPVSSYEHVFLLTKRPRYYYDCAAIAEPVSGAYAKEAAQGVQYVRGNASSRGVLHSEEREHGTRLQAVQQSARHGVASDAGRQNEIFGSKQIGSGDGPHGSLFRFSEGSGGDNAPSCSSESEKEGCNMHSYSPRVAGDQGERRAQVPLLQQEDGPSSNGSCDTSKQRRSSRGVEHRPGLQELQQQERHQGSYAAVRSARNVWSIATSPFSEAHFATFPPELAERCIKAGTSERGCCAACGAPWVRQTADPVVTGRRDNGGAAGGVDLGMWQGRAGSSERTTTGWAPTCGHDAPTVPCTVLDPFAGAFTTALVADRLQRHAIGIELSPEYCAMARRRIADDAGMFAEVEAA